MKQMNELPTHVLAEPGNRKSLCGIKDPLPVIGAAHVAAHVAGYGMVVCSDCEAEL